MQDKLPQVILTIIEVRNYEEKIAQLEAEIQRLKLHYCENCDLPAFNYCPRCEQCGTYSIVCSNGVNVNDVTLNNGLCEECR